MPRHEKISTRSDTNQAIQPKKLARGLKFWILLKWRDCTIYVVKKNADQLRGYQAADLLLCFHICKKQVFS